MAKMTLVVLAAGMGSRFGERIKQLEPIGPKGELLIDYSVFDALRAGFDRVVFIIRHDIEELFKSTIGDRVSRVVKTEYVFQSPDKLPCRAADFPERTKPWGTAQALYCCKDVIDGPFAVINADDFYGADAFMKLSEFLNNFTADGCSVDFLLKNTLSDNGTVNRGVCKAGADGLLTSVEETRGISRGADGVIRGTAAGGERILDENDTVSMSMWGFGRDFMPILERRLRGFLEKLPSGDPKSELTIADAVGEEITENGYKMRDIPTNSVWFGVTYESDAPAARETISHYVNEGIYPCPLN
ncbi:MAG: sugar phosphate nucleotidyltransferase [Oscillospiraceae bacterium]